MDSLQGILKQSKYQAPDEISLIKSYIAEHYKSPSEVKQSRGAFIVSVPNSALAATIFLKRQELIEACQLKAKLVVRTG